MTRIDWPAGARKELERLDRKMQERIKTATVRLAEIGHGDVRRVQESPGELPLRVGDWRIFFVESVEQVEGLEVKLYRFLRVRPRGRAYGR